MSLRTLGHGTRGRMLVAFGGGAVPVLAGLALVPWTLRLAGPETFAWISVSWILLGNTSWVDLGLGRALVQRLAARSAERDGNDPRRLLGTALTIQSILGALLVACATLLAAGLPRIAGVQALQVACVAAGLLPALWANTLRSALEARLEFAAAARVRVPVSLALLAWPCILAASGAPLWASLLGLAGVKACAAWAYAQILARRCDLRAGLSFNRGDARELLTFGGWSSVSSLAGPILGYAERGLLAAMGSGALLGLYAAVLEVLQRALIVPASMASVLFPSLSSGFERRDRAHTDRLLRQSLFAMNLLVWPALALFWIGAEFGVELLLGEHATETAVRASRWLALAIALNAFAHLPYSVLYAAGRPALKARLDLIELPLYLGLSALLIAEHGLLGAAWAKVAVSCADLGALGVLARRELGPVRDAGAWRVQARFTAGAALAAASAWAATLVGLGPALSLVICSANLALACATSGARPAELWRQPTLGPRSLTDDSEVAAPAA